MIYNINPGRERASVHFYDHIVYSHVKDREGNPMDLEMSILSANGNLERRLAMGDSCENVPRRPLLIWFNGGGWHCTADMKNSQLADMEYLAEAGYIVAFIHYRNSDQGRFPAQLIDCKTAVRFLRANAKKYAIDPDHIGVIGRSAGGMLSAWMAMNTDDFETEEWSEYSSKVQAAVDMFGAKDIEALMAIDLERVKQPGARWDNIAKTHEGKLLDLTDKMSMEELTACAKEASPIYAVNDGMCPLQILHGTVDQAVPLETSKNYYNKLKEAGLEDRVDLYIVENAGHGSPEFFQPMTQKIIADFFDKHLK